ELVGRGEHDGVVDQAEGAGHGEPGALLCLDAAVERVLQRTVPNSAKLDTVHSVSPPSRRGPPRSSSTTSRPAMAPRRCRTLLASTYPQPGTRVPLRRRSAPGIHLVCTARGGRPQAPPSKWRKQRTADSSRVHISVQDVVHSLVLVRRRLYAHTVDKGAMGETGRPTPGTSAAPATDGHGRCGCVSPFSGPPV